MKWILACLFLLLIPFADRAIAQTCPGSACPGMRPALGAQSQYPQVVQVAADEGGGCKSLGTGVIISRADGRAYVATVQHTFRDRAGTVTVTAGGQSYAANVVGEDAQADAAILSIPDPGIRTILVGPIPAYGAKTWVGGFARRAISWTAGVVRSMIDGRHLVVSGGSQQGWSGGPVIDSQGRVVAILHATDGRQTWATPLAVYRRLFWRVVPLWRQDGQYATQPTEPEQPAPEQPTPGGEPAAILARIEALQAEVAVLQAAVEVLTVEPIVGPPGPQGPRGPPGEIDLDALAAAVVERLPPITFQAAHMDGTPAGEAVSKRLGETVILKSYLVNPPSRGE